MAVFQMFQTLNSLFVIFVALILTALISCAGTDLLPDSLSSANRNSAINNNVNKYTEFGLNSEKSDTLAGKNVPVSLADTLKLLVDLVNLNDPVNLKNPLNLTDPGDLNDWENFNNHLLTLHPLNRTKRQSPLAGLLSLGLIPKGNGNSNSAESLLATCQLTNLLMYQLLAQKQSTSPNLAINPFAINQNLLFPAVESLTTYITTSTFTTDMTTTALVTIPLLFGNKPISTVITRTKTYQVTTSEVKTVTATIRPTPTTSIAITSTIEPAVPPTNDLTIDESAIASTTIFDTDLKTNRLLEAEVPPNSESTTANRQFLPTAVTPTAEQPTKAVNPRGNKRRKGRPRLSKITNLHENLGTPKVESRRGSANLGQQKILRDNRDRTRIHVGQQTPSTTNRENRDRQRIYSDQQRASVDQQRAKIDQLRANIDQQRAHGDLQRSSVDQARTNVVQQRTYVEPQRTNADQQRKNFDQERSYEDQHSDQQSPRNFENSYRDTRGNSRHRTSAAKNEYLAPEQPQVLRRRPAQERRQPIVEPQADPDPPNYDNSYYADSEPSNYANNYYGRRFKREQPNPTAARESDDFDEENNPLLDRDFILEPSFQDDFTSSSSFSNIEKCPPIVTKTITVTETITKFVVATNSQRQSA